MAKTKISEFDTNPDLNTDINSINIAEGCAPSGINNAIRTLMSDLKDWQSGAQDIYVAPAGTAAAPSWTFNGDTDSGFYRYAANEVGVATNGSNVGRFTSVGWVGNVSGNLVNGTTATTQAAGTNDTTVATTAFVTSAISAALLANIYPVGSIYINSTNATNPGTLLGFGTWVAFGAGRVPVGFNAANPLFDTAEETGGSADAIVVSHTHTGTTDTSGSHFHNIPHNYDSATAGDYISGNDGPNNITDSASPTDYAGMHTHTFTTGSTGSSGTNANYQPYITVYMWKRTA